MCFTHFQFDFLKQIFGQDIFSRGHQISQNGFLVWISGIFKTKKHRSQARLIVWSEVYCSIHHLNIGNMAKLQTTLDITTHSRWQALQGEH